MLHTKLEQTTTICFSSNAPANIVNTCREQNVLITILNVRLLHKFVIKSNTKLQNEINTYSTLKTMVDNPLNQHKSMLESYDIFVIMTIL